MNSTAVLKFFMFVLFHFISILYKFTFNTYCYSGKFNLLYKWEILLMRNSWKKKRFVKKHFFYNLNIILKMKWILKLKFNLLMNKLLTKTVLDKIHMEINAQNKITESHWMIFINWLLTGFFSIRGYMFCMPVTSIKQQVPHFYF